MQDKTNFSEPYALRFKSEFILKIKTRAVRSLRLHC